MPGTQYTILNGNDELLVPDSKKTERALYLAGLAIAFTAFPVMFADGKKYVEENFVHDTSMTWLPWLAGINACLPMAFLMGRDFGNLLVQLYIKSQKNGMDTSEAHIQKTFLHYISMGVRGWIALCGGTAFLNSTLRDMRPLVGDFAYLFAPQSFAVPLVFNGAGLPAVALAWRRKLTNACGCIGSQPEEPSRFYKEHRLLERLSDMSELLRQASDETIGNLHFSYLNREAGGFQKELEFIKTVADTLGELDRTTSWSRVRSAAGNVGFFVGPTGSEQNLGDAAAPVRWLTGSETFATVAGASAWTGNGSLTGYYSEAGIKRLFDFAYDLVHGALETLKNPWKLCQLNTWRTILRYSLKDIFALFSAGCAALPYLELTEEQNSGADFLSALLNLSAFVTSILIFYQAFGFEYDIDLKRRALITLVDALYQIITSLTDEALDEAYELLIPKPAPEAQPAPEEPARAPTPSSGSSEVSV